MTSDHMADMIMVPASFNSFFHLSLTYTQTTTFIFSIPF